MTTVRSIPSGVLGRNTRVLIVDDSAVVRSQLRKQLTAEARIEIVGAAADWTGKLSMIADHQPDVIVLDAEMPSLGGSGMIRTAIENLRSPVIVLASPTAAGGGSAVEALASGAADAVAKPASSSTLDLFGAELIRKIHRVQTGSTAPSLRIAASDPRFLAVGSPADCLKSLVELIRNLPAAGPATLVIQQLPSAFTSALVRYLGKRCLAEIHEARDGDTLQAGRVLIAPGGKHMLVRKSGPHLLVEIKDGPEVDRERPSIELFFRSIDRIARAAA